MLGRGACATVNCVWKGSAICIYFPVAKENKQAVCHFCIVVWSVPCVLQEVLSRNTSLVTVFYKYCTCVFCLCNRCSVVGVRLQPSAVCSGFFKRQNPLPGTAAPNLDGCDH